MELFYLADPGNPRMIERLKEEAYKRAGMKRAKISNFEELVDDVIDAVCKEFYKRRDEIADTISNGSSIASRRISKKEASSKNFDRVVILFRRIVCYIAYNKAREKTGRKISCAEIGSYFNMGESTTYGANTHVARYLKDENPIIKVFVENVLSKLDDYHRDTEFISDIIDISLDMFNDQIQEMTDFVLKEYKLPKPNNITFSRTDITGNSRKREFVIARQACMHILKKMSPEKRIERFSLSLIGGPFSKDHATVIHANKQIFNILETNYQPYADAIEAAEKKVRMKWKTDKKNKLQQKV